MIHVFEGPEGAGKTTLARWASEEFGVPTFFDAGRHGSFREMTPREWMLTGTQCNLDVAEFSRIADFIVDRWILTSWVYDGLRRYRAKTQIYERIVERSEAIVFVLFAPVNVLLERIAARTEGRARCNRDELDRRIEGFREAVLRFDELGLRVRVVDAEYPEEVVQDEVRGIWRR